MGTWANGHLYIYKWANGKWGNELMGNLVYMGK